MKRILYSSLAVISALFLILSCAKENNEFEPINEGGIKVTLNIGKASLKPSTKTEIVGTTPYWSVGDQIGVSNGTTSNALFSTGIAARALIASFSGTVESAGDYYAYYPYTTNGVGNVSGNYGAKVDLPANQYPTATSFDGSADIMLSTQFTVTETTPTVNNLEFARLGAVVKIVLIDSESIMSSQHPSTVSMTAESNLAGRVLINMENQCLEDPYYNETTTVTANYTSSTKYEINGTNATYLIVVPQVLAAGSTLTIAASTEAYSIEKVITVPAGGIDLQAGKITTLNITLTSAHITSSTGAALPFSDDMAWADNGSTDDGTDIGSTISTVSSGLYSTGTKAYKGKGGLKLGTGSYAGSITTKELDLSGAFYIVIESGKYGSDTGTLEVSVDGDDVITGGSMSGTNYVNIAAGTYTNKSKVTIATSAKRGYIYSVNIASGTYVPAPVINVTSANPMEISNANDLHAITYTISNPTGASVSASANVSWIHDFDYSVDGEVSFEVDAQATDAVARSGIVTLSYTGATDVPVTVNQAAGPTSGSSVQTLYLETFGDNGSSNTAVASATSYTATQSMFTDPENTVVSHYTSDGKVGKKTVNPSDGYTDASGLSAVWYTAPTGTNTKNLFTVDNINISGASSIGVSFGLHCSNATNTTVNVYYKIDSGSEQTLSFTAPTSNSTWTLCSGSISGTGSSLKLRFEMVTTAGYTVRLDDIKVIGTK